MVAGELYIPLPMRIALAIVHAFTGKHCIREKSSMNEQKSESTAFLLLQLILLAVLIFFACFWRLGDTPIKDFDEVVAVRAVQSIHHGESWLTPVVDGKAYLRKPPFKMWLAQIPLYFLGESNFSYRLIDAVAGAATALLVFFFSRHVFKLWGIGLFSAMALLGCRGYILTHCVRTAVHDSMVTFLSTAAICCCWLYCMGLKEGSPHAKNRRWIFLAALLSGAATITKSVVGLFPLLVLAPLILCDRALVRLLISQYRVVVQAALIAAVLPTFYFGYHFLCTEDAWGLMVKHEVVKRITKGFHHQNHTLFYFRALFIKNLYVNPFLVVAGLGVSAYCWLRWKEQPYLLLLVWSILPTIVLNTIPSRLAWYLAPALPGMAMACGVVVAKAFGAISQGMPGTFSAPWWWRVRACFFILCAIGGVGLLGYNYSRVIKSIDRLPERMALDHFVERLNRQARDTTSTAAAGPVLVDRVHLSGADKVYLGMLGERAIFIGKRDVAQVFNSYPKAILITQVKGALNVLRNTAVAGYGFIKADMYRASGFTVLARSGEGVLPPVSPRTRVFHFGKDEIHLLYGFEAARSEKKRLVRDTSGSEVAFLLPGDSILTALGGTLSIKSALHPEAAEEVRGIDVYLNSKKIGSYTPQRARFKSTDVAVDKGALVAGDNVVSLKAQGASPGLTDKFLMMEQIGVALGDVH